MKPRSAFSPANGQVNGIQPYCRECIAKRALWQHRADKHGICVDTVERIFERQDKCCAICKIKVLPTKQTWHLDHDHKTGTVRGLLCPHCNHGLGFFRDNPEFLAEAIKYLLST